MKGLKLPIISKGFSSGRILSADEYCKFVQFNLKNMGDRRMNRKWKVQSAVNVRFSL
jgi:hypothetical protein